MVFYFTTSCLADTHNSFLSLLFNSKSLVFYLYKALQIQLPILYFLYSASGGSWAHTYWIGLDIKEAKRKKGHTWVFSLALQFWPVLQARHICPLLFIRITANSLRLPAPLAAEEAVAVTPWHRGTQITRKSKIFVINKVQENREKNKAINHSERGE